MLSARRRLAMNARTMRELRGLTQESAAEKIGCSVQALQRLERAATNVTLDFITRVAHTYGLDLSELFIPSGPWQKPAVGRPSAQTLMERRAEYGKPSSTRKREPRSSR